ncbi:MAG TPA: exosortase/archaeosortase family protein [Opitutus sp.]|nr:exosortase/archaeosortase family protein [Opitutus sp.]
MSASVEFNPGRPALRRRFRALPELAKVNAVLLGVFLAALVTLLWPHWRSDPDLSHGFLALPLFLVLLHESRSGTQRFLPPGRARTSLLCVLLAFGLLALCTSGVYAAALDWSHALVAFVLSTSLSLLLAAGLVGFAADGIRLLPLNWSSVVAIVIWPLSAPIPPGSYSRLTIALQLSLTEGVIQTLHLLGIAAVRHGNIIELGTATIGVEDACSGIRSLISCFFAGLFFSATMVRRTRHRVFLIVMSVVLAIVTNFLRSLTLTLLANSGLTISAGLHDATGFAVLGVTAVLLGGLALLLERREPPRQRGVEAEEAFPTARTRATQRLLAAGLGVVAVLAAFFFLNTRPSVRSNLPVPDLAAMLPDSVPGWRVDTAQDLYQFSDTLHTDHLEQRSYFRDRPDALEQITIYLAYWRAGQAPVSLVAMHTPDACWPGSGWVVDRQKSAQPALALPARTLPAAESRFFTSGGYPQYVWFWHLYNGRPITYQDPYSAIALLKIAWHYGFVHDGDQVFVRVSSNRPWSDIAAEPPVTEFFARVRSLGL